jgi:hypothetical protein
MTTARTDLYTPQYQSMVLACIWIAVESVLAGGLKLHAIFMENWNEFTNCFYSFKNSTNQDIKTQIFRILKPFTKLFTITIVI